MEETGKVGIDGLEAVLIERDNRADVRVRSHDDDGSLGGIHPVLVMQRCVLPHFWDTEIRDVIRVDLVEIVIQEPPGGSRRRRLTCAR